MLGLVFLYGKGLAALLGGELKAPLFFPQPSHRNRRAVEPSGTAIAGRLLERLLA